VGAVVASAGGNGKCVGPVAGGVEGSGESGD